MRRRESITCLRRRREGGDSATNAETGWHPAIIGAGLMAIGYPRPDSTGRSQLDHDVGKRWLY